MTLRRSRLVLAFLAILSGSGSAALAQALNPGWIIPNPHNARYLEIAPPNGIPFAIASYGALKPCDQSAIVSQAVDLKNKGATYARLWYFWSCEKASVPPHVGPWQRANQDDKNPQWDLRVFDEVYWNTLRSAVDAARNMNDGSQSPYEATPIGVRLAVEVPLFKSEDFMPAPDGDRRPYNPFFDGNNINEFSLGTEKDGDAKTFIKAPYYCKVLADSDPNWCKGLGFQEAYVRKLIDVTAAYGNVIYEVMNEPLPSACGVGGTDCLDAYDYFGGYWAQFVTSYLADTGRSRVISHASELRGYEIADVAMATIHMANDDGGLNLLPILSDLAYAVRTGYLHQPAKVTAVDEMGNADGVFSRLRKKAWTIIASGGHFHMEDPCDPNIPNRPLCEGLDAKPWNTVLNVNRFLRTSGWKFHWARPQYQEGVFASKYFYWMVQDDPAFDTVGSATVDHVGYLANRQVGTCDPSSPLLVNLPALPGGFSEYVAWLWAPGGTASDNYVKNAQGNKLQYHFTWAGGDFDWCTTPLRNAILTHPTADLVFQVHGVANPPVQLSVTKGGTGGGRVVSTAPNTAIHCGTVCSASYPAGTSVTLSATPNSASTFGGWSGGGCTGTQPTCTTLLSSSKKVTATFQALLY